MASVISANLDDEVMSTLASELADPNRSVPSQTGVPSHRLTQQTLDNFLANWNAAVIAAGPPPAPATSDSAAPDEPPSESPPV